MASKAEYLAIWWILSVWILNLSSVNCQNCPGVPSIGPGLAGGPDYNTDYGADAIFLISTNPVVDCYGVVKSWAFESASNLNPVGQCYSSMAQIWRPTSSNPTTNYILVGENTLFDYAFCQANLENNGNANNVYIINVPTSLQIPVQPGDVIAWRDIGINALSRKISFESGLPGSSSIVSILQSSACAPSVGNPCSWAAAQTDGRKYGIQATLGVGRSPVFINMPKTISIPELQPVATFVYQVKASYDLTWNPTIPPVLVYEITSPTTPTCSGWFAIGPDSGTVSVASLIRITSTPFPCSLTVKVYPFGAQAPVFATAILTVNIYNVNEPITITNLPSTVHYNVMSVPPQTIFTLTWSDPDASILPNTKNFAIVSVQPVVQTTIFSIGATTGVVSTSVPQDWTGPDVFKVNITASDGVFLDGPKTLTVILDNVIKPPVIQNLNATTSWPETMVPGTIVFTVKSLNDPSRPTGITINYTITSQVPYSGVGNSAFIINNIAPTQAQVLLGTTPLNYLIVKQYQLEIQATQFFGSSTLKSEPRTLTIDVTWVDSAPTLTIMPSASTIPEDTPTGTPVPGIKITATDRECDNNLGDYLVFFVSDPHFVVNNVTKTMYTSGSLFILPPKTCAQTYSLQVLVRDSYGRVDSAGVTVTVNRINREGPKFNQTQYNGSVAENGVGGSPTGVNLSAPDPDCLQNGTVTYTILGELPNLYFQVDASGVITQKQPISQPTYPNMTFTVVAADGGQPSFNTTALVFINVSAVNAHAPWFAQPYMELETRSDSSAGSSIYKLNVTDPDSAAMNNINYQIVVLQDDFDVRSSGDIVLKRKLSSYKRYTLYVMATDTGQGMNYFTDPATVVIDTYDAANQLIDIKMLRPLVETDPKLQQFMAKLNNFLKPWVVKMEDLKYDGDDTVVTIYACNSAVSTFSSEPTPKHFIDRDELLAKLRTDIYGTPVDGLRGTEFEEYEIVSVMPAYPVWILDTVEGIATLTVVCVVALALIIVAIVLLLRHFKLACFRNNKVAPAPEKNELIKGSPDGEEFHLGYVNTEPFVAKTAEVKMSDVEPFDRPPTYRANSPPFRPDADLQL